VFGAFGDEMIKFVMISEKGLIGTLRKWRRGKGRKKERKTKGRAEESKAEEERNPESGLDSTASCSQKAHRKEY
jgi:hypothetical protein